MRIFEETNKQKLKKMSKFKKAIELKVNDVIILSREKDYKILELKISESGKMVNITFEDNHSTVINFGVIEKRINTKIEIK